MKARVRRQSRSGVRRERIIRAALSCFTEIGFTATGMSDICRKAGASIGSVYHHFGSKEQLAAAVYLEGIREYQNGIVKSLSDRKNARAGVRRVVRFHLTWVASNLEWARFLFRERQSVFMDTTGDEFTELNRKFAAGVIGWFNHQVEAGILKKLPWDVQISLLLGPCQEYSRLYLEGTYCTKIGDAVRMLSQSVWQGLAVKA